MKHLKHFLLVAVALLCSSFGVAQNRDVSLSDIALFGNQLKLGDLIMDTPTRINSDSINQLRYTNVSKSFPNLKDNGTIWIDGSKIGKLCEIRFLNGTETTPWHISSASIKPLPNTRVEGIVTANSYGGFLFLCQGLKHLKILGSNDAYYGLNTFPTDRVFLAGSFGFSASSKGHYGGYHMFSISVLGGGSIEIEGFEGEHGFSIGRFQGGNYDNTVAIKIYNFFIRGSGSEGTYIGATHGSPYSKIANLTMYQGIFAFTGSEALQMQHLVGNSNIYNITLFATDASYLKAFQPGQDTGIQLNPDEGNTIIRNLVVDGWGSHALNCFGAPFTSSTKRAVVKNIFFNNGRGEVIYFHPSVKYGMTWSFDSLYIRKPNGEYYINNKVPKPNWLISANNGTDLITIGSVFHDGTYSNVYQNTSKIVCIPPILQEVPDIKYVNSGFYEPANRIKFWTEDYAKYISGKDSLAVDYKDGDIVSDREDGKPEVWCKVLKDHSATSLRPKKDTVNCMILSWDAKGTRNDQCTWAKELLQRPYPPCDLRVAWDSYWGLKNVGFVQENPNLCPKEVVELRAEVKHLNSLLKDAEDSINILTLENNLLKVKYENCNEDFTNLLKDLTSLVDQYK